jgi:hypothetical protein
MLCESAALEVEDAPGVMRGTAVSVAALEHLQNALSAMAVSGSANFTEVCGHHPPEVLSGRAEFQAMKDGVTRLQLLASKPILWIRGERVLCCGRHENYYNPVTVWAHAA